MIFRYTILYVENVEESINFYCNAFGFEKLFIHEAGDYGELSTGDTKLAFSSLALMTDLGKSPAHANAEHPTFELAFESTDVASDLAKVIDAGATLIQDAEEKPWGQTISYVSDPNGYLIEICSAVAG